MAPGRHAALEGLRGVLALAVLVHHLFFLRYFAATGKWVDDGSGLSLLMGPGAVGLFFMLSAWLFCGRIAETRGQLDNRRFLGGRVRRIMPGWILACLMMFAIVGWETGFAARESIGRLAAEALAWLTLWGEQPLDVNGHRMTITILSVGWSLRWEWLFYATLPLAALLWRRGGGTWAVIAALALGGLVLGKVALFAGGALALKVAHRGGEGAWLIAAGFGLIFALTVHHLPLGWTGVAVLLPLFVLVLRGAPVVAWLGHPRIAALGRTSYGVYLFHNPLLYVIVVHGMGRERMAAAGPATMIALGMVGALVVLAVAEASWRWIERPLLHGRAHKADQRSIAVADMPSTIPPATLMIPTMRNT